MAVGAIDGVVDGELVGLGVTAGVDVPEKEALAVLVVLGEGVRDGVAVIDGVGVMVAVVVGTADGAGAPLEQPCRRVESTEIPTFRGDVGSLAEV